MDTLKLWKKLNAIVRTGKPMESAKKMIESGGFSVDEMSWVVAALATLPITMFETMREKGAV